MLYFIDIISTCLPLVESSSFVSIISLIHNYKIVRFCLVFLDDYFISIVGRIKKVSITKATIEVSIPNV